MKVCTCPKCGGNGYTTSGDRCSMCGGKRKVEDGGPSPVAGNTATQESDYIGESGYRIVVNLPQNLN